MSLNLEQIDQAIEHYINYGWRYKNNKDDEQTFDAMLMQLSKEQLAEVLFQIACNTSEDTFLAIGKAIERKGD